MINPTRATRLEAIEADLDDLLDWETNELDRDVLDMLEAYEEDLIRNGDL